jgi:hypothetical protein
MDRREFLAKAGMVATWAAIAVTVTDCGGKKTTEPPGNGGNGDIQGQVSVASGHSHSVVITHAEIVDGHAVVLTLTGSGHTHTVSLTADEVMSIGGGGRVSKQSTTDSQHSHTVTFN